jgi:hypothetical protein
VVAFLCSFLHTDRLQVSSSQLRIVSVVWGENTKSMTEPTHSRSFHVFFSKDVCASFQTHAHRLVDTSCWPLKFAGNLEQILLTVGFLSYR